MQAYRSSTHRPPHCVFVDSFSDFVADPSNHTEPPENNAATNINQPQAIIPGLHAMPNSEEASTGASSSSNNLDLMPVPPFQHVVHLEEPATSMELLGNQVLGIHPTPATQSTTMCAPAPRTNQQFLLSQLSFPQSLSQFCQLGSTATFIDFP